MNHQSKHMEAYLSSKCENLRQKLKYLFLGILLSYVAFVLSFTDPKMISDKTTSFKYATDMVQKESIRKDNLGQKQNQSIDQKSVLTNLHIEKPFHTYSIWNGDFPCYEKNNDLKNHKGILYVKLYKAASSTLSGVAMQMAERHKLQNMTGKEMCNVHAHHSSAREKEFFKRIKDKSFLWTFVRDPKKRAVSSYFFFKVTLQNQNPTGPSMLEFLRTQNDFQTNYLRTLGESDYDKTKNANQTAVALLKEYDFVGLVEFLDESLVVMRLLLGLDAKDILYLPAKQMGTYAVKSPTECRHIYKQFTTPEVDRYLESDEWTQENELDYALWSTAKRTLQATILSIGKEKFEKALKEHKQLLARVQSKCIDEHTYPCSEEGERQKGKCYWNDIGCGHECIDGL